MGDFNPRTPCGVRRPCIATKELSLQSTHLIGCDRIVFRCCWCLVPVAFNSHPSPMMGASCVTHRIRLSFVLQIHAPTECATQPCYAGCYNCWTLTHVPLRGATLRHISIFFHITSILALPLRSATFSRSSL